MSFLLRRALSALLSLVVAFTPLAEAIAASPDLYFRYRIDGVDSSGMHVLVRGPTAPVLYGAPVSIRTGVVGGVAPYSFALGGGSLPRGFSVDAATGNINGVAADVGRYEFMVRAADAGGSIALSQPFRLDIQYKKLEIVRTPSLSARKGETYTDRMAAVGGREPYAWSLAEGTLPGGITLDPVTGVFAGTPTVLGQFPFRIRLSDAAGGVAATGQLVLFVDSASLTIAGSAPPNGNVGSRYTGRFEATGGAPPYIYVLPAGSLPPGLSLDGGTGWIDGVLHAAGLYPNIKVRAVDSTQRYVDSAPFGVNVFAKLTASWTGQSGVRDVPYSGEVKASGGRGPYSFALTSGELPQGLSLNPDTGMVSGTPPNGAEVQGLDVRVVDASGNVAQTGPFSISVSNKLAIVSAPTGAAVVRQSYTSGFATGGGTRPYAYRLVGGTLPGGLTLSASTGVISGIPTQTGKAAGLQVQVTDAQGETALSSVFSIDVRTPVTVSLKGAPSIGTVGQPYSGRIEISGGIAPYASSLSGRLAPGLSYDAGTGSIAGVPTAAGTFDGLVVQVQDADGRTGSSAAFSILVANPLVVGAPETAATVGTPFSTNTSVGGGRGPFSFSASPSVPSGLALDTSTGAISGTPTAAGVTAGFRITVRDQDGRAASTTPRDFVVIDPFLLAASMPSIATEAVPFDGKASASGGSEPYSFFLYDGSLPKGLSLDAAAGAISGTPTSAGVYRFTIGARDASGRNAYVAASVEVVAVPTVVSAPNRVADLGKAYASSAKLQGGRAPFVWSLAAGSMPPGLTLDGTSGALSGIPTTEGLYEGMALRVVDVDGRSAVGAPFVIDVRQPLSVSGAPATDAETGIGYTSTFVASGGTPPYAWSLASGHLPGGVTLDPASGRLSGTPTQGGRFDYAVKATDAVGRTATTASHHIVVASEFSIVGQPMPTDLTVGQAFQHAYRTQNGDAPIAFSIASGTLPAGLTMSPAGVVTGTPSRAQTARGIVVAATDGAGRVSALPPMDLDVRDPVAINGNPPPGATFSRSYSARFEIVGGRGPFTFASSGNALPPGLAYSVGWDEERQAHYGVVSGVPNALGSYTGLSASATDAAGRSGTTVPFDIHVIDAFAVEARLPGEATVGTSYQGIVTASDGQQPYV